MAEQCRRICRGAALGATICHIVAANDGGSTRAPLRHADADARLVASVMRQLAGVASEDIDIVVQPSVAALRTRLTEIADAVREHRAAGGRTDLVFYYSGHSDDIGLLLGGERLAYTDLRELLEAVPADIRLGVLDSCSSGALTREKGGRHRAPFLSGGSELRGEAFLLSSAVGEVAQESDRIGGSYCTHHLVTGLRGAADRDHDQILTLASTGPPGLGRRDGS